MKLSRILQILSVIILSSITQQLYSAKISHVIHISPDMVNLSLVRQDSLLATEIKIDGASTITTPQLPRIPIADISYALPANVRSVSVTSLEFGDVMSYPTSAPIVLNPKDNFFSEVIDMDSFVQSLYEQQNIIKTIDSYKGINNVVNFSVPLASVYNDHIDVYKTISITLEYDQNEKQLVNLKIQNPTYYINSGEYAKDINALENLVENPQDINENAYTQPSNKAKMQVVSSSINDGNGKVCAYEYCIITPKKFASAFNRIALIKRAKGINAGVVYLENILTDERFKNGTLKPSNGSSEAMLREFLYWSYTNGCRYALLGGKPPLVPVVYAIGNSSNFFNKYANIDDFKSQKGSDWHDFYIPTDLYFSNFENNWDSDNDGVYGEYNDKLSYNSQISIGRLPCTTEEEIINYIHKLEFYELNMGRGNLSHYGKCHSILASYKTDSDINSTKNFYKDILNTCESIFQNATFYSPFQTYGEEYFPLTGQKSINILNSEKPCFVNVHAHGNPTGFGFDNEDRPSNITKPYGVNALDSEPKHHWDEEFNGIDCLDNFGLPSILYASSCTLMPFDCPKYDNYGSYSSDYDDITCNFGESFVLGKNYGGVAMIGNTRYGWVESGKTFSKYFLENIESNSNLSLNVRNDISKIMNTAKVKTGHDYTAKSMNIYGDPSLCIRNNVPVDLSDCFGVTRTKEGTIIDKHNYIDGFDKYALYELVVISSTDNTYSMSPISDYGNEDKSINPNDMVYICRGDAIPYVSDLEFVGDDLKSGYHYCNNARLGCRDSNRIQTVTKIYGKTIIDAMGDVEIGSLFDIDNHLVIYAKGYCILDSAYITPSGTLEIHCDNILYADNYDLSEFNHGKLQLFKYDKYDSEPKPRALKAKAQALAKQEYNPLLEEGKSWHYNYKVVKNLAGKDVHDRDLMLKLEGNKEIDGKQWHALNFYCDGAFDATVAYLYEDTESARVYIKHEDISRYLICNDWFGVPDGILYDFNNPGMEIISHYCNSISPVEVVFNGKSYFGWKNDDSTLPLAAVDGLGLIPYSDNTGNKFAHQITPTLLGYVDQLTGGTLNIYPYLYKIADKDGNVLYEIKENEFNSEIASSMDKINCRAEGRIITIENPLAKPVTVTDAAGMQLHQSSDTNISIDVAPGIYIIVGGENATKLIVK